jgi:hypothetical protein
VVVVVVVGVVVVAVVMLVLLSLLLLLLLLRSRRHRCRRCRCRHRRRHRPLLPPPHPLLLPQLHQLCRCCYSRSSRAGGRSVYLPLALRIISALPSCNRVEHSCHRLAVTGCAHSPSSLAW